MTKRSFLDLSTAHLTSTTRERLDQVAEYGTAVMEGLPTVYSHPDGCGWLVYVPPEDDHYAGAAPDLLYVLAYAREQDCDYVLFDRDALIDPNLPDFTELENEANDAATA